MSDDKPSKKMPTVEPAAVVKCPLCGGVFPVVDLDGGKRVVVQPFPVRAVAPAKSVIHTNRPVAPDVACRKVIEGTMTARLLPPVFIPHQALCPGRGLPPLVQDLEMLVGAEKGEQQDGEAEVAEGNHSGAPEDAPVHLVDGGD